MAGEPQLVFNYCAALSNYLNNFTFGKGMNVQVDRRVQHIVPALVERILTRDNKKKALLWNVGQLGGVSGDAFVKVAYEPPSNPTGRHLIPGRVRILPLNPAFCFPEWAPHDMERLLRFKLKYRFWATAPDGTRQVYTYTEIITDEIIEEYVNDQLIDQRINPLGEIPIVHIPNKPAASSPWGLSDIQDILPLNRAYNETATEILDIINYYTAPVTIVTGHKASNMERGANKLWGITNKDAKVYNLEGGAEGLPQALEFLELLEHAMHKMTGVPVTALGEEQQISNTSGVALHIQFFPLMMAYCNTGEAPIWMADKTFKSIDKIQVGDEVMGWEWPDDGVSHRRLVKTKVTDISISQQQVVRVMMESGRVIRCTPNHRWLNANASTNGPRTDTFTHVAGKSVKYESKKRADGYRLGYLSETITPVPVLTPEQQREADWLAGIYDGEGCNESIYQSGSHNPEVCKRIERALTVLDIPFSVLQLKDGTIRGYKMLGGKRTYSNLLNWTNITRREWFEYRLEGTLYARDDKVISIEPDGVETVYGLTTDTHNYVAWGYASSNSLKTTQYEDGWKQILYFALRTLFMAEPDTLIYDPATKGILEDPDVQPEVLDPEDPAVYDLEIRWPPPLPVDVVIKLNEIMMKMQLGLESKVGALLDLGEEYPDEKRLELFEQRMLEAKMEGAEQILKANIAAAIMELTGTIPEGMGEPVPPPPTATPNAEGQMPQAMPMPKAPALGGLGDISSIVGKMGGDMLNEMTTLAYGTKIPQARQIDKNDND